MNKKCSKCQQIKLFNEFGKCAKSNDGHKYYCKICDKAYNKKRYNDKTPDQKEELLLNVRAWQEDHSNERKQYQKTWQNKQKNLKKDDKINQNPSENTENPAKIDEKALE